MNIWGLFGDTSLALLTQPVSVATITARLQWELWRENVIEWCVTPWIIALSLPPPIHTFALSMSWWPRGVVSKLWLVGRFQLLKTTSLWNLFLLRFRLLHIENVKMLIRSRQIYKRSKFLGRYPTQCLQLGDASSTSPFSNAHAMTSYSQKHSMTSAHKNERLAPLAGTEQPCNVTVFYSTVWNSTYFHL